MTVAVLDTLLLRLASRPVKVPLKDTVGERLSVALALVLPPPMREGVMGLDAEGKREGVVVVVAEAQRDKEGEGLCVAEDRGLLVEEVDAEVHTEALTVPELREEVVGAATVGVPDTVLEEEMPPLVLTFAVRDTDTLADWETVGVRVRGMEAVKVVDFVRVAPPPPCRTKEGEGVVLRVLVVDTVEVTLGQLLTVVVMSAVGVMRGVEDCEALNLGVNDARLALAWAEEVLEREGMMVPEPVRVTAAGVAEKRALAE